MDILAGFSRLIAITNLSLWQSLGTRYYTELPFLPSKIADKAELALFFNLLFTNSNFSSLLSLDLTGLEIGDDFLRYLINLEHLECLGLSDCKISDTGIRYLECHGMFPSLKCLKLCNNPGVTDRSIPILKTCFLELEHLDLLGTSISDKGLVKLVDSSLTVGNIKSLRIPIEIYTKLMEQRSALLVPPPLLEGPVDLFSSDYADIIDGMNRNELQCCLRQLKKHYSNVFLNLDTTALRNMLKELVLERKKEEKIWSLL